MVFPSIKTLSGLRQGITPVVFNALYGTYNALSIGIFKFTKITDLFEIGDFNLLPVSINPSNLYSYLSCTY